ncbi:MAG: hypothetical protein GY796_10455 [Chloroflexi bacterium]|nr:hypothetical protein [Chloroflexota bacterium]
MSKQKQEWGLSTIILIELAVIIVLFINGVIGDTMTLVVATVFTIITLSFWAFQLYRKRYEIPVAAADTALQGLLGDKRVEAVYKMRKTLPKDISGEETAVLLSGLLGADRVHAIDVLVKARKLHHPMLESEMSLILSGLLGQERVDAIELLSGPR